MKIVDSNEAVLVTGGSGFIGTHLVQNLLGQNYRVLNIDVRPPLAKEYRCLWKQVDIMDAVSLASVFRETQPSLVVHMAARTDLDETRTLDGYAANIQGVRNMVDAIASTPSVRRAIFASSMAVCKVGYVPVNDLEYSPLTLYGESKVHTERIVRAANGGGAEWCIVRPTTVWGPGMKAHYTSLLQLVQSARYFHIGRKPLYKSYGYVGNVVFEVLQLLNARRDDINGKVFYVADYEPLSLRHWLDSLRESFGGRPLRTLSPGSAAFLAKMGDLANRVGFRQFPFNSFRLRNILTEYCFDMTPTATVCGPLPYSFEDGVRFTAQWYLGLRGKETDDPYYP
jgi:GlcNAc-P-P-Und epimerase